MGKIRQIWNWLWVFLHLEGCKTTKYHIFNLILLCVCQLICINSRYLYQSRWDSDITQENLIWLSFCSFWGLTTRTSPNQAKVVFNFKTVLFHREIWASLPCWQIQSNLFPIRWLSQSQVTCLSIFETILYELRKPSKTSLSKVG